MRRFHLAARLVMVLAVVACGAETASPALDALAIRAAEVQAPVVLDDALQGAIEIREQYGLRANPAWVRMVAEHPDALTHETWGIPLMPDELADVMSRRWPTSLVLQVRTYGLGFPDEFATAYINLQASGVAVEFTRNLDRHRAALAALPLDGPFEVRQADWSLKDLERFLKVVKAEQAWIESTGAGQVDPVIYEIENRVVIRYEGPEGLENLIEGRFGSPSWLEARWEGPSPWEGLRGPLLIEVRDTDGRPVPNVWCEIISEDRRSVFQTGDMIFGTGEDGDCEFRDLPAVTYRVRLHDFVDNDHYDPDPFEEFKVRVTQVGAIVRIEKPSR